MTSLGFHCRRLRRTLPLMAAVLLMAALPAACGAPASRPAKGPIGDRLKAALESGSASFAHDRWHSLLAGAARDGLLDYRFIQEHAGDLHAYLDEVAAVDLGSLAPDHLKALLINAYNALTVASILAHPQIASIREIDGVWNQTRHRLGGFEVTLDEIEHNLLRPYFRDPRIHFAVNCASYSCAPLPPWAYTGEEIETQLDVQTRAFLTVEDNVQITDGVLHLSRYFDWYGDDFVAAGSQPRAESIPLFVATYTSPEVAGFIADAADQPQVAFLEYDWKLNAAVPPDPALVLAAAEPAAGDAGLVGRLRQSIVGLGPAGGAVYVIAYALLTVAFVPAWPLTVGAGAAYGVVLGTVLVSAGSVSGAALAFLVGRYLLRSRVERWVEGNHRFASIDRAVGREGWKIVGLTRLSPVFPFNLLNYAYGLTSIGFVPYVLVSWIAMLPGTILYVYIGAVTADVTQAATGAAHWGRTALQGVGLAATLAVTLLITRIARRALRETAAETTEQEPR